MLDLILHINSIPLLKLKLSHEDIKIRLMSNTITPLCIKVFDQLKVSTFPKITLL